MDHHSEKKAYFAFALTNWIGWLDLIDFIIFRVKYGIGWYEIFHGQAQDFLKNTYDTSQDFRIKISSVGDKNTPAAGSYLLDFSDGANEGRLRASYRKDDLGKVEFDFNILNDLQHPEAIK